MPAIPYDASRNSLFHPGSADDFFTLGSYDTDAALCAEMSRLAYVKEQQRLIPSLQRAGFELVEALGYEQSGTQAFVANSPRRQATVVAFRGTEPEDPSDLLTDARFILSEWNTPAGERLGKAHDGFAQSTQDGDLFTRIRRHLAAPPATARVLLTGHSLGAALATLLASWLPSAHLYTYGSPRVGDAAFAQSLQNPVSLRFVNCCDLTTRVPPKAVLGYAHTGVLAYIDRTGRWLEGADAAAIAADRRKAAARHLQQYALVSGALRTRELADHAAINYVSGVMGIRAPDAG